MLRYRYLYLFLIFLIMASFTFGCSKEKDVPVPATPEEDPKTPEPVSQKRAFGFLKENGFCTLAFYIDGGLIPSVKKILPDTEPYADNIGAQIVKALLWDLDHRRDIRKGDSCKVLYKRTMDRFKIRVYGITYTSQKFEKTYSYYFFWEKKRKFPEFFTEAGTAVSKKMKNCPLKNYDEIVALYRAGSKANKGVKFRVRRGVEVFMPFPAVVLRMNWNLEIDGISVEVRYPGTGKLAQFTHLSAISDKIEPGAAVSVGTIFARTGVSGKTQTPHLEYRMLKETENGLEYIDPFEFHGLESYILDMSGHRDFVSVKHQIIGKLRKVDFPDKG